ncbi:MAG: hypothetical protein DMG68_18835 [Acidobacteria bacterium]|jgi:hypothetical protein|nr:MAG: hypothetical protein DMG68_18835 [Acidobacteriota bacterium]
MKAVFFVLCILCATAAMGQSTLGGAALSAEPQIIQMCSHPQHAYQRPMATPQVLLESSEYVHARGVRPLWEVGTLSDEIPLGDIARALRKDRETVKRAEKTWQN